MPSERGNDVGIYLSSSTRSSQLDSLRSQLEHEARITAEASQPGFLSPDEPGNLDALAKKLGEQIDARVTNISERVVYMVTGKMEEIGISKY